MNLTQLQNIAKLYQCHLGNMGCHGVQVYAPDYSTSELVTDLEHKQTKDIQTILEKLSGKKIRELWTGGKGGGA